MCMAWYIHTVHGIHTAGMVYIQYMVWYMLWWLQDGYNLVTTLVTD